MRLLRAVALMTVACMVLTLEACSDDDDEGDSSSSSTFTPGGQFSTNNGTVYLTSASWLEFSYTDGKLAQVYASDLWYSDDDEDTFTVTHDPLTFTGTYMQLTDIEQNSDGFITSLSKTVTYDEEENCDITFSYNSSGYLATIEVKGESENADYSFTWSKNKITEMVMTDDWGFLTYTDFEYSVANVTLQYGPYIELFVETGLYGLEMLFYLGYLGKAPAYHPSLIHTTEDYYDDGDYDFTSVLNSDGSLKHVASARYAGGKTFSFTYQ